MSAKLCRYSRTEGGRQRGRGLYSMSVQIEVGKLAMGSIWCAGQSLGAAAEATILKSKQIDTSRSKCLHAQQTKISAYQEGYICCLSRMHGKQNVRASIFGVRAGRALRMHGHNEASSVPFIRTTTG